MLQEHPLKTYRVANGLSQEEMAVKLEVSSVSVSRWETGARKIDTDLVPAISEKTGIPKAELRPDLAALFSENAA